MQPVSNTTTRFSDRVEEYIRFRPRYPREVLDYLGAEHSLRPAQSIADVGAGTGIFSELLLESGHAVAAVEPNAEMRAAAVRLLGDRPGFSAHDGTAERTTLPSASVDWVTAAQAFHWFDVPAARREFGRILRPPPPGQRSQVVLLWNNRREDGAFLADYEHFCREFGTDYLKIKHQNAEGDGRVPEFYGGPVAARVFRHEQRVDFDGLRGRTLSCSYIPNRGQPRHEEMLATLEALFRRHAREGCVVIEYDTHVYAGLLR